MPIRQLGIFQEMELVVKVKKTKLSSMISMWCDTVIMLYSEKYLFYRPKFTNVAVI